MVTDLTSLIISTPTTLTDMYHDIKSTTKSIIIHSEITTKRHEVLFSKSAFAMFR